MKVIYFIFSLLVYLSISACAEQKYKVETVGYSSWEDSKMIVRRKAILLNTETGETWGLAYKKGTPTRDGYSWQKLPIQTEDHSIQQQPSNSCDTVK